MKNLNIARVFVFMISAVGTSTAYGEDKTPPAPTPEQIELLKEVDVRYQKAKTVKMGVQKTDKLAALEKTKELDGTLWLKKGKFRLELQSKDKNKDTSLIVADGKNLWFVTPPPKEFKDAKTQVLKAPLNAKKSANQGLLQILTEGGVLKYFKATGVIDGGDELTYLLKPETASVELQEAQVTLNRNDKTISGLKYFDSMKNETIYSFNNVEFDKTVKDSLLSYKPPKSADVTNY